MPIIWLFSVHNKIDQKLILTYKILLISVVLSFGQTDSVKLESNANVFNYMLDSIITETLNQNPNVKAYGLKTEASRAAIGTIKIDAPLIAVDFYQSPITSFPNPFKDQMEIDYSILQVIPFPGKLGIMADAGKNRSKMSEMEQQTVKQETIRLVKNAFYETYLADRQLDINSSSQELIKSFIDIARRQYELGIGKQTDILRAQTELYRLASDRIKIVQSRQSIEAMINSYRNKPVDIHIQYIPEISAKQEKIPALDSLLLIAIKNRPELKSMQYNISMQSFELQNAKKEYYPDFMVRGMYKQMINQADDWSLMLGVNLPIAPWSIEKYSAAVNRSKALVNQAQAEYDNMRNMIASQVKDAQAKYLSSHAQVDLLLNTIIPQARQTLQSALSGYQTGKLEFLMLIDTQRMLLMAQQDYHMAVMNLLTNYANLQRAIGSHG